MIDAIVIINMIIIAIIINIIVSILHLSCLEEDVGDVDEDSYRD